MSNKELRCTFCGKFENSCRMLIRARQDDVYICDECVDACLEMLEEKLYNKDNAIKAINEEYIEVPINSPKEIREYLDRYIISQNEFKKILGVAVYKHYIRVSSDKSSNMTKSNILLLGPTGTGKTASINALSKFLNVPIVIADATTLTETGYSGDDVEVVLLKLLQAANYDTNSAEKGIIYIDEIDKIGERERNSSTAKGISDRSVQECLLKMLEGNKITVTIKNTRESFEVDTTNILFICGGAFVGIEETVQKRLHKKTIGFGAEISSKEKISYENIYSNIDTKDIINYGILPEFVGRFSTLAYTLPLKRGDLRKILIDSDNSIISEYNILFEESGIELYVSDCAINVIVDKAIKKGTGARGLRAIMDNCMNDIMYDCFSSNENISKCIINSDVILHGRNPVYKYKEEEEIANA